MSTRTGDHRRRRPAHPPFLDELNRPTIIFVTVCAAERRPILAAPDAATAIVSAWMRSSAWQVGRYVIMPDHVHLFCAPGSIDIPLGAWIQFWKSLAARLWPRPEERPLWQPNYWDTQLRGQDSYVEKWQYVVDNPVRKGLTRTAADWPYAGELNALPWCDTKRR